MLLLLLAGCGRGGEAAPPPTDRSAGAALERAAAAGGLIGDPSRSPAGAWARDTDRACIVPGGGGDFRIGIASDYGGGQGCRAAGTLRRSGGQLELRLGVCTVHARFDGDRIVLPPELPSACDAACTGRASLAAMVLERQSEAVAEAAAMRSTDGTPLCAD